MTQDPPYDGGYSDWCFAIHCKRLSLLAEGKGWWRNCVELYASEALHLWRAV